MKVIHELRKYDNDLHVWTGSYDDTGFLPHWHQEIELIFVKSGSTVIRIDGKNHTAKKGDLIICDSGETHSSPSFNMANSLEFMHFGTNVLGSVYHSSDFDSSLIKKETLVKFGLYDEVKRLFEIVGTELEKKQPYCNEIIKSAIRYFWYLLKRHIPKKAENGGRKSKRAQLTYDMQRLQEYINNNFTDEINLEIAAKQMGMSECHLSRLFKSMVGMSFVSYINTLRTEHAAELLRDKKTTIIDVALSCGFNNIRTFNRVFKAITGYSPSQFRKLDDPDFISTTYFHILSEEIHVEENDSMTIIRKES